jgi:uncharacterized membrane protein YfcA
MDDGLLLGVAALATGLVGGFISGLFGVGGGIVIVPVLDAALGSLGVDATVRMQMAVATSLATIVPTSIASARAHHRRGAVDLGLARRWALALMAGAAAGSWLATGALAGLLPALFGTVAAIMAVKMLLPMENKVLAREVPSGPLMQAVPLTIGAVSSMMGIGGGTLSVPTLTLMNQPVHRAVGTANLFGLAIALPGTVGYLLGQPDAPVPPGTIGLVNIPGLLLIATASVLAAPWGACLAHRLDRRRLRFAFGAFLLLVAARMLYRNFA